jgi:hypothetical protein
MSTMMEISDAGNGGGDDPGVSYQLREHRIQIDFSYEEAAFDMRKQGFEPTT